MALQGQQARHVWFQKETVHNGYEKEWRDTVLYPWHSMNWNTHFNISFSSAAGSSLQPKEHVGMFRMVQKRGKLTVLHLMHPT